MSDYSSLKATINANIKANNNHEITGAITNSVLNAMVDSLGAGYQFMGVATPTNPGTAQTPDYKCFYLATTPGTYTNLGGLVVAEGEVAILKYDTAWTKEVTGVATADQVSQLGQKISSFPIYSIFESGRFLFQVGTLPPAIELPDTGYVRTKYIQRINGIVTVKNDDYRIAQIVFYDSDQNYIGCSGDLNTTSIVLSEYPLYSALGYVRFSIKREDGGDIDVADFPGVTYKNQEVFLSSRDKNTLGILVQSTPFGNKRERGGMNSVDTFDMFSLTDVSIGEKISYSIYVETPGKVGYISFRDANETEIAFIGRGYSSDTQQLYEGNIEIPQGFDHALFYGNAFGVINYVVKQSSNIALDKRVEELENSVEPYSNLRGINAPVFLAAPITIMSSDDENATEYDNARIGFSCILKDAENLFILYYSCQGLNDVVGDAQQHIAVAYSTNGKNYTRGIPSGKSTPFPGTNLISQNNITEFQVFKVKDDAYPYRMVARKFPDNTLYMFFSADGITFDWENGKRFTPGTGYDTQVSVIKRGNTLKTYCRTNASTDGGYIRGIGVSYNDVDGEYYTNAYTLIDDSRHLYNSGASPLTDHSEILFPSVYSDPVYGGDDSMHLTCFIVDNINAREVDVNYSNILSANDKAMYVMPGIFNTPTNEQFILLLVEDATHNSYVYGTSKSVFKICRILFNPPFSDD